MANPRTTALVYCPLISGCSCDDGALATLSRCGAAPLVSIRPCGTPYRMEAHAAFGAHKLTNYGRMTINGQGSESGLFVGQNAMNQSSPTV